ncbi:recombinase family protein, partial [Enterococcus faecium]|uniref:recombinase family protein n=1 Tax=Enterococcus faecium TaxID=1352 RepID=UPI0030C88424
DMALEYARTKDWLIHEIYNEGKCSARKTSIDERPELTRLLSDIEKNKIQRVLVFKRDRLARNVQQYIEIYRLLKKYQVELHLTADNEPPSFEGAASEFIEAILAGMSEYEGNNIVNRLKYSKISLIRQGYWQAGSFPYAYRSIKDKNHDLRKEPNGKLEINPERANVVRSLYK